MLVKPMSDLVKGLEEIQSAALELLLDRVMGKEHLSQAEVLRILNLLKDQSLSEPSPVDSSITNAILQTSR